MDTLSIIYYIERYALYKTETEKRVFGRVCYVIIFEFTKYAQHKIDIIVSRHDERSLRVSCNGACGGSQMCAPHFG